MNGWFIAYLMIIAFGLGISLVKHGEDKNQKYNFGVQLIASIIDFTIIYFAIKTGF